METVLLELFVTYTDVPSGETITLTGAPPAVIVGVESAERAPVEVLREYMETVPAEFVTYTDKPSGDIVIAVGCDPVVMVGVASAVSAPVEVLREYMETV